MSSESMGQVGLHCATENSYGNISPCAAPLSPSMTPWQRCHHNHHHQHLLCPWIHQPSRPQLWFLSLHLALQWLHPPLVICGHRRMVRSIKFTPHLHLKSMIPPSWGTNLQPPLCAGRLVFHNPSDADSPFTPQYPWVLVCANRTLLHLTWTLICFALTANRTLKSNWIIACGLF